MIVIALFLGMMFQTPVCTDAAVHERAITAWHEVLPEHRFVANCEAPAVLMTDRRPDWCSNMHYLACFGFISKQIFCEDYGSCLHELGHYFGLSHPDATFNPATHCAGYQWYDGYHGTVMDQTGCPGQEYIWPADVAAARANLGRR